MELLCCTRSTGYLIHVSKQDFPESVYLVALGWCRSVIIGFQCQERWLSGRKRQIANLLYDLGRTEGSNPSLSVLNE